MAHFNLILGFSILFLFLFVPAIAQKKRTFSPSVSLTTGVLPEPESFFKNGREYLYVEVHGILKIHTIIGKNFSTGIYLSSISNYSEPRGWANHIMSGLEFSYLLNITKRIVAKPTLGTYLGNFCACRNRLQTGEIAPPIKKNRSFYLGGGADIAFKLTKESDFYLLFGLHTFSYLNNLKEVSNYAQPQLGIWWKPDFN